MELLHALRETGALHFKSQDFEVSFTSVSEPIVFQNNRTHPSPEPQVSAPLDYPPPPVNQEAVGRVQSVMDTLKLKDEELANALFPDGAGG